MPRYLFHCEICNTDETVDKKMSEYNPDEPCKICNNPMTRKVENMVCGYQTCKGFYGKTSN